MLVYELNKLTIKVEQFYKTRGGKPYYNVYMMMANRSKIIELSDIRANDAEDAKNKAMKFIKSIAKEY